MITFNLARIIGNELSPRDTIGNRIKSLEFILENEFFDKDCSNLWILNQIHDKKLFKKISEILKGKNIVELKFEPKKYYAATDRDNKIIHAININKARNLAIEESNSDFTFVFDGDCFFNKEFWHETINEIIKDQAVFNRQYYGVPGYIIVEKIPNDFSSYNLAEPSLVIRKDAKMRFNESIPFSKCDKIDFLLKIGYLKGEIIPKGNICCNAGRLLHISFNKEITEIDIFTRMSLRDKSIDLLLKKLDYRINFL
jgi:plasmid maintenance system killer protein